jgi:hypothetical protein
MRKAPDERASPLVPDEQASARLTIAGVTLIIGEASDESALLLATIPPTPPQRRLALALGAGLIVLFRVAAPIAAMPLPQLYAIIPIIVAIFFLSDLITAALLFSQFSVIRSHASLPRQWISFYSTNRDSNRTYLSWFIFTDRPSGRRVANSRLALFVLSFLFHISRARLCLP